MPVIRPSSVVQVCYDCLALSGMTVTFGGVLDETDRL